jgi:hypothetical protein
MFCLEEHCVFGWMSKEWVWKILVFGLWIGVFCIAGFNYAVSVRTECVTLCLCVSISDSLPLSLSLIQ